MMASSSPNPRRTTPSRLKPKLSMNRRAAVARFGVTDVTRLHPSWSKGYAMMPLISRRVSQRGLSDAKLTSMLR
jgi:hypothetical protein